MTLDEIERAIALAKSRGLAELEVGIGQGGRLKVIVNRPQKAVAAAAPRPVKAKDAIRTHYFGVFADASPAIHVGDSITEHQIVGFLELGEIRFAIQAEKAGKVAAKPVKTGDLVGYGETVFEFQ